MTSFLIVLIFVSTFFYGFSVKALPPVLIAVLATTLLDLLIQYYKTKSWEFPYSALISGLFIGGLLTQNLHWYIYISAGVIAILSKHLIKFQQNHIFNPANFGVLLVSIIFGVSHTWWVSSSIILVLIFGIFIIWRLKRFDLTLSFLISYLLINLIIKFYNGANINDLYLTIINGDVIYFFSMYMLIEPKTNPSRRKQRIAYGFLVAVLFVLLHFYIPRHDLPLALAIGNVFVPILNKLKFEFKGKQEQNGKQPILKTFIYK